MIVGIYDLLHQIQFIPSCHLQTAECERKERESPPSAIPKNFARTRSASVCYATTPWKVNATSPVSQFLKIHCLTETTKPHEQNPARRANQFLMTYVNLQFACDMRIWRIWIGLCHTKNQHHGLLKEKLLLLQFRPAPRNYHQNVHLRWPNFAWCIYNTCTTRMHLSRDQKIIINAWNRSKCVRK